MSWARPRFLGRLGPADLITVSNAALGMAATAWAVLDPAMAARLVLLAGVADGLDGLVARRYGGSGLGEHLDSLADVASFGVAPAALVFAAAHRTYGPEPTPAVLLAVVAAAAFVGMGVLRLALYTVEDGERRRTEGVQTTLAATLLAGGYLAAVPPIAGLAPAGVLVALAAVFAYLMVTRITYPELLDRDAIVLGALQMGAVIAPVALSRAFPRALVVMAGAYLVLAPRFYWR